MRFRFLSFTLGLALPLAVLAAPQAPDIVGAWTCGPYETPGPDLSASTIDRRVYSDNGYFTEHSFVTYTREGLQIRTETRNTGTWSLQGDLIEVRFNSSKFLSSDHPAFTVAHGQATLDAMRARKNSDTKRILRFDGQSMVTIPLGSMDAQGEVQVSCSRG
ncbi:hypothetical protein [Lysobacter sp. Root983]|uniref:hypothetical protein n=1 Tax=Lysobacter sp. Root983 TaxID=1736613 RepID=UPI00070EEF28|nr:hypothetical protein [Lysobacter sp. Root983]KRD80182.1 hypothetical protein ASE43_04725 [Lysobacter sp. Root983]